MEKPEAGKSSFFSNFQLPTSDFRLFSLTVPVYFSGNKHGEGKNQKQTDTSNQKCISFQLHQHKNEPEGKG